MRLLEYKLKEMDKLKKLLKLNIQAFLIIKPLQKSYCITLLPLSLFINKIDLYIIY